MEIFREIMMYLITAFVGGFSGWFFTKEKYNVEVKGLEVNNEGSAIELWKDLVTNLSDRVNLLDNEIKELRNEVIKLHKENLELKKLNLTLEKEINILKSN